MTQRIVRLFVSGLVASVLAALLQTPWAHASAKQILTYNNRILPETLDPASVSDVYSGNVLNQIFEGLTSYNPRDFETAPGVASRWEVDNKGTTYTFTLNPKAKWSDGSQVVASDFVYAWLRLLDPKNNAPYARYLFPIKNAKKYFEGDLKDAGVVGIKAVNNTTLEVRLEYATPYFLRLTAFYALFPLPEKKMKSVKNPWNDPTDLIFNGPFILVDNIAKSKRDFITLKRNPHYWQKDHVKLTEVRIFGIQDPEEALRLYSEGKIDHTGETPIPPATIPQWRYRRDFKSVPWFGVNFLRFNVSKPPFDDVHVRNAVAQAIDREQIALFLVQGGHQPANSFVPEGINGYKPARMDSFSPSRAQETLARAGYCTPKTKSKTCKKFPKVVFLLDNNPPHVKMALGVQEMLRKHLGIDSVELRITSSFDEYLKSRRAMNYDIARSGWVGDYYDPNTFLELWTSSNSNNQTGWSNAKFDQYIEAASHERNPSQRMKKLSKAEEVLLSETPVVPVYHYFKVYLMKPYVRNYFDNLQRVLLLKDVYIEYYSQN